MKLGIISDIHGNYPALLAVLARLDKFGITNIVCLGDVCGYYCQPNECIEEMRKRDIFSLLGNHDAYLLGKSTCSRSNTVNKCIEYQRKAITTNNIEWLDSLQSSFSYETLAMMHGGPTDFLDEYVSEFNFDKANTLFGKKKLYLSGHTHVPSVQKYKNQLYCNPGSVGQPRDGDCRASFALFDNEKISIHRICYDIDKTAEAMENAGFNSYFYKNLYCGRKIGDK